jgi:DNA-binding NarL/FixJ family response regulator
MTPHTFAGHCFYKNFSIMKVIIADDHAVFRQAFCMQLMEIENLEVAGEAADATELCHVLENTDATLLFLDIRLGSDNGLKLCREITEKYPFLKVIIITMYEEENYFISAIGAGAKGFLLKPFGIGELRQAIEALATGRYYYRAGAYHRLKGAAKS